MSADAVMGLVREYAAGMGARSIDEQAAAYLAVQDAVAALARPSVKQAAGWAVLDAEDRVLVVELSRVVALDTAERIDGARVAPLVVVDLDDERVQS